jgi:hypothetical protein
MFCDLCIEKYMDDSSELKYKIIDFNNDSDIVKLSKKLVTLFTENYVNYKKKGNFWTRTRITDDIHTNCFGESSTFPLNIYNEDSFNFEILSNEAWNILNHNGFSVEPPADFEDMREILMEVHYANSDTDIVYTDLSIHTDNQTYRDGDVHTLLVYIDVDCEGGDLEIYDDRGKKVINVISTKCNDKTRCVLLNGNCYHKPTPIIKGKRLALSFQFQRERDYFEDEDDQIICKCPFGKLIKRD